MTRTGVFQPFWPLIGGILFWYLFHEGLKALGLVKSK